MFLPNYVREVYHISCGGACCSHTLDSLSDGLYSAQNIYYFRKFFHSDDYNIRNHRCFERIFCRKENIFHPELTSKYSCWEGSLNGSHDSIECELPEKESTFENRFLKLLLFSQYSKSNREVVEWSFFSQICWCKVYGDASPTRKCIS